MIIPRTPRVTAILLVALLLAAPAAPRPAALAQGALPQMGERPAHLLRDINTSAYILPRVITYGREAQLSFGDEIPGVIESESVFLTTDGTAAGTRREGSSAPGLSDCYFFGDAPLRVGARTLLCIHSELTNQYELWGGDGTVAGSASLGTSVDSVPVVVGDRAFFVSCANPWAGCEPWVTDGTRAGTRLLKNFNTEPGAPGVPNFMAFQPQFAPLGDTALFLVAESGGKTALYRSDGTAPGSQRLAEFQRPEYSPPTLIVAAGDKIFFQLRFCQGEACERRLYVSDGTGPGTRQVAVFDEREGWVHNHLIPVGGRALLILSRFNAGGEIWASDGTAAGTAKIFEGSFSDFYSRYYSVGPAVYIASDRGLLRSDGTSAGTKMLLGESSFIYLYLLGERLLVWHCTFSENRCELLGIGPGEEVPTVLRAAPHWLATWTSPYIVRAGAVAIFGACGDPAIGCEPWRSDGTPAGTFPLGDIRPGQQSGILFSYEPLFASLGARALLVLDDGGGPQIWATDGSSAGTVRLTNVQLNRNAGSYPFPLLSAGGLGYFSTSGEQGQQLWATDGSVAGTRRIDAQTDSSRFTPSPAAAFGARLAYASTYSPAQDQVRTDLRITSGGPGDTIFTVEGRIPQISASAGRIFFTDEGSGQTPARLLVSDGTGAGTRVVGELGPGYPRLLRASASHAFALMQNADDSARLVGSDGTAEGTATLLELGPYYDYYYYLEQQVAVLGDQLLIFGRDAEGAERLYHSDGTPAGTGEIAGPQTGVPTLWPRFLANTGSRVFFGVNYELWVSDGTSAGTASLATLGAIYDGVAADGGVYLYATEGAAEQWLWFSDGTAAGTRRLIRLPYGSYIDLLAARGGVLLFSQDQQLWRTDGTAAGTFKLQQIRPSEAAWAGDALLLSVYDSRIGAEPWAMGPGAYLQGGLDLGVPAGGRLTVGATIGETWPAGGAAPGPLTLTLTHDPRLTYEGNSAGVSATVTPGRVALRLPPSPQPLSEREVVISLRAPDGAIGTSFALELSLAAPGDPDPGDNSLSGSARIARLLYLPNLELNWR